MPLAAIAQVPPPVVSPAPVPAPEVAIDFGLLRGVATTDGVAFKGIPYAAPPVGDLRWKPPRLPEPWKDVRDATQFGLNCPQPIREGPRANALQGEDCLTINVATPRTGTPAKLPVLVAIHGGAFAFGSAADNFDKAAEVMNRRGIVYVAMNYRVGRLGFFAHPGLRAEAGTGPFGNYWLMDQIAALQWVKRNIAAFGGDPSKVTILGCSAGGSSVNSLMVSPDARGLFAGASAHSGGGLFNATRPLDVAEKEGLEFAQRMGVAGEGMDAVARLRLYTPAQVIAAEPGPPTYGAIIDGRLLQEDIGASFARGAIASVPYMAGSTSNEASVFGLMGFDAAVLKARFGIDLAELKPAYDPDSKLDDAELLRQVQTDFIFTSAATGLAGMAGRRQPSWAYHFGFVPPAQRAQTPGAPHCADMGYSFGNMPEPDDAESQQVALLMQGYLENFVRKGDPNGESLPRWPHYSGSRPSTLLIEDHARAVPGFREQQLRYWHRHWSAATGFRIMGY